MSVLIIMPRLTVTLSDERAEKVAEMAESEDYESKSEVINYFISMGENAAEIKAENERLQREKSQLLDQREENSELVAWAEDHRSLLEDEYERRNAPLWKRLRWFIYGKQ